MCSILNFSNGISTVRVTTADKCTAFHLQNYLAGQCGRCDTYDWHVIVRKDPYPHSFPGVYIERLGEYQEPIHEYSTGEKTIIHNCRTGSVIVKETRGDFSVYNESASLLFVDAYRIVRQLLIRDLLNRGGVVVHSSAIAINSKGYLFLGKKGAGKSTALFQYLTSDFESVAFLGNDRNVVLFRDGKLLIYGWQGVAFIGLGTIAATVGIEALYDIHQRAGGTAYLLTEHQLISNAYLSELLQMESKTILKIKEKLWLAPMEIATVTNRARIDVTYLDKLILPRLNLSEKQKTVRCHKSVEEYIITDLDFFSDWLHLGMSTPECCVETRKALENAAQLEISGDDLLCNLECCFV